MPGSGRRARAEVAEEAVGTGRGALDVDWAATEDLGSIGAKIRRLRQDQGLPLRDLSARTGLSIGFLSLVQRGRSSLGLTSLYAVAKALGSDVARFFPDGRADADPSSMKPLTPTVVGADDDAHVSITSSRRVYRLLSDRAPNKVLEPMRVTIQPTDKGAEPYSHDGEEFCYVLD
jgi:transcriptional regulator with XRE-family HTH domain